MLGICFCKYGYKCCIIPPSVCIATCSTLRKLGGRCTLKNAQYPPEDIQAV